MRNGTIYIFDDIIGKSESMQETIAMAKRFAVKKMPVMIYGETGTGKEMFAQSIHNASPYMSGAFVPINCGAIPETLLESTLFGTVKGAFTGAIDSPGLFEKAENGTIFLDEINSMPIALQVKLLRALQEKEVRRIGDTKTRKINCRILSATNKMPMEAIRDGEMREDLFYRLSTGLIFVPPLRERHSDVLLLANEFIQRFQEIFNTNIESLSQEVKDVFLNYDWPGNVRELEHVIEGAMMLVTENDKEITLRHIPENIYHKRDFDIIDTKKIRKKINLQEETANFEKALIKKALRENRGNITASANSLGIHRNALYRKIEKYKIEK